MPGIAAYARTAGILLLALAAVGTVLLGWDTASISYHAAVGPLSLYVGFSRLGPRPFVGVSFGTAFTS